LQIGSLRRNLHSLQTNTHQGRAVAVRNASCHHDLQINRHSFHRAEFANSCKISRLTTYFHKVCGPSPKDLWTSIDLSSSTQNQALSALLFLYRHVLEKEFGWLEDVVRAKMDKHVPEVFAHQEALAVLANLASWEWQYLFPADKPSVDPRSGVRRRHHLHASTFARAMKQALRKAGLVKHAGAHTFRHSFATRLLERGQDIRI
jgi:site-specific recombinase XerD